MANPSAGVTPALVASMQAGLQSGALAGYTITSSSVTNNNGNGNNGNNGSSSSDSKIPLIVGLAVGLSSLLIGKNYLI